MPLVTGRVGITTRLGSLAEGELTLLQLAAHQIQQEPRRLVGLQLHAAPSGIRQRIGDVVVHVMPHLMGQDGQRRPVSLTDYRQVRLRKLQLLYAL